MCVNKLFCWTKILVPAGVAANGVPPLVLVDINTLDISLCVDVVCAAGQTLEEASPVATSVDPGSVVIPDPPHYPGAVTLHHPQVSSHLPPEPGRENRRSWLSVRLWLCPNWRAAFDGCLRHNKCSSNSKTPPKFVWCFLLCCPYPKMHRGRTQRFSDILMAHFEAELGVWDDYTFL